MLEVSPLASVNHTPLNEYSLHCKNISLDLQELKLESTKSAWWRRGADGRGPCRWAWPLVPFLHELSKLIASRLPPRDNLKNNNLQNIFSYSGWGSDGGKMSLPWSGENDINLQPNMFSCSKPWVHFIKPMPASVFLYGAIHLWRTIKWPIVCLGFSVHWLSLVLYTFELNFHLTPVRLNRHRAEGSWWRRHCWTDVDLWERAGSCLAVSPTLSLEFLPALLLLSLATLICCVQRGGLFGTWLFVLNC